MRRSRSATAQGGSSCSRSVRSASRRCVRSYRSARPFRPSALRQTLLDLPAGVFRVKGVLALTTPADRRAILQMVGRRITLTPTEPWGADPPTTELVVIGAPGLEPADLQRRFDAALAE